MNKKAIDLLKEYYGYTSFRPLQAEIIENIVAKKDTLVLMPTGGGKSVCFQIPAMIFDGVCIVISPLISLMKDQVDALNANGIPAAFLNSSINKNEENRIIDKCLDNKIKLLYLAPERLVNEINNLLRIIPISLFAVDEAHCISSWGHDFRPEYTQLKLLKECFPKIPIVALTATADKTTRKDIIKQLDLKDAQTFISSFDRPNLSLTVYAGLGGKDKMKQIITFIKKRKDESGIIYCLSRSNTEKLAAALRDNGINADCYHAGLTSEQRSRIQEEFINDNVPIVCATIAFGMGIDKSNVRWVMHYNLPKNIEGYYQEIGRAGRDGLKSDTILFYSIGDLMILTKFAQEGKLAQINLAKLKRMQQYAEADICRRKILLSYFGEVIEENCGNCDVCKNPREHFDGSIIVQKALSAVHRTEEKIGMNILIDILRGSNRYDILEKGYNNIKTYGVGKDISADNWNQYILQMLNLGYLEIAYDESFALKITPSGKNVLMGKAKALLVAAQIKDFSTKASNKRNKQLIAEFENEKSSSNSLMPQLKALRKEIASRVNMPAYIIFHDSTLEDMIRKMPTSKMQMLEVSGMSMTKYENYGYEFLELIQKYLNENTIVIKDTYSETLALFSKGMKIEDIAKKRELSVGTIFSHLEKLYREDQIKNIDSFVSQDEIKKVFLAVKKLEAPFKLREIFDALEGEIDYIKIKFALVYLEKIEAFD
jgi:ATP-dependent DNA helicase RecQ